jgi:hypothetical protein
MYAMEQGKIDDCVGLYPFLEDDTLKKISNVLMKKGDFKAFTALAPFL